MQMLIDEDQEVPTGKHAVRASIFIKHMKLLDDPLTEQIEDAHEAIKDIPDESNDMYYLKEFTA